MSIVTPYLWFANEAEEAAHFYVAAFRALGREASIDAVARYGPRSPMPAGSVMSVDFTLDGRGFAGLNGGPVFTPTPAVSLMVTCRDQAEVDGFWERLGAGGQVQQCGWLTDRWGFSWQVVPAALRRILQGDDAAGRARAFKAMMAMRKLDIAGLQAAYDGAAG